MEKVWTRAVKICGVCMGGYDSSLKTWREDGLEYCKHEVRVNIMFDNYEKKHVLPNLKKGEKAIKGSDGITRICHE